MTYRTTQDFGAETSAWWRALRSQLRRIEYLTTDGAKWQLQGQRGGGGGDEVFSAEPFTGFGFYARPPASGSPEVIVGQIGGAKHPVVLASRDEETRRIYDGQIGDGETAIYNDKAIIVVKADGTVEIRLANGIALPLATKKDLDDLSAAFTAWTPAPFDGGAALKTQLGTLQASGWPHGTTVLRAQ